MSGRRSYLAGLFVLAACGAENAPHVEKEPPPPGLKSTPRWLTYTCVEPGCDATIQASVEVIGDRDVAIKRIVLSDRNRDDFTYTPEREPPFILKSKDKFNIDVRYQPSGDPRLHDVSLSVTFTDASASETDEDRLEPGELEVPLVRRLVGEPKLAVAPEMLNFGPVLVSAEQGVPLMISNVGFGNVGLILDQIESDHPGEIRVDNQPDHALLPGTGQEVSVVYAPAEERFLEGSLRIKVAGGAEIPTVVPYIGTSIAAPTIAVEPELGVDFGEVPAPSVGHATLVVSNHGAQPLFLNGVELLSQPVGGVLTLDLPRNSQTATIAPLGSYEIGLDLESQQPGEVATAVRLTSSDALRPVLDVPVIGVMTQPIIHVEPAALDFGNVPRGWTLVKPVEVSNLGYGALVLTNVNLILGSSELFTLRTIPALPIMLQHGQRVGLEIEFRSEVEASFMGILAIDSNDAATPFVEVNLAATGASCDLGCPITNGVPTCLNGTCEVESCNMGWYDSDSDPATGCECREVGTDPGSFCAEGIHIGNLTDEDSSRASFTGIVPTGDDIDMVRFHGEDQSGFLSDEYDVRVSLESSDPGIQYCIYRHRTESQLNECYFENESCPQDRAYRDDGSLGPDDGADYVIKVYRVQSTVPTCTSYTIFARNG